MIPKIIHTVWVGPTAMPDKERTLFEKNQSILQDYTFKLWNNETIADILPKNKIIEDFVSYATAQKKWAFISDLVKVIALVKFGGWALDADNEIVAPLSPFERMHWVSGFELWNKKYAPITAVWGAIPYHRFSLWMLNYYLTETPEHILSMPNTRWISQAFLDAGIRIDNTRQYLEAFDVEIFPSQVFCGPPVSGQTVALHHFSASWV